MITIITSVWILRVSNLIDGWTFLLLSLPILLISTLIADKRSDLEEADTRNWQLLGINTEISIEDEAFLDQMLDLGSYKSQQISKVDRDE